MRVEDPPHNAFARASTRGFASLLRKRPEDLDKAFHASGVNALPLVDRNAYPVLSLLENPEANARAVLDEARFAPVPSSPRGDGVPAGGRRRENSQVLGQRLHQHLHVPLEKPDALLRRQPYDPPFSGLCKRRCKTVPLRRSDIPAGAV
jgi:hypothetical protein